MSKVEKFEDLIAWQKARELTREIYTVTKGGNFKNDFNLKDQIRRASVSIMSNIAEGFDRAGRGEFHQFLVVAKGSCAEVKTQLYIARDIGYVDDKCFIHLQRLAEEVSRIIGGLRSAVHKQRKKQ